MQKFISRQPRLRWSRTVVKPMETQGRVSCASSVLVSSVCVRASARARVCVWCVPTWTRRVVCWFV